MDRKIADSLQGLSRALQDLEHDFPRVSNDIDSTSLIEQIDRRVEKTRSQLGTSREHLEDAKKTFEMRMRQLSDRTMKIFTILIGYSAPAVIIDVGYKLMHHEHRPELVAAALGMCLLGHALTYQFLWKRKS